jgi:hypothetical protein
MFEYIPIEKENIPYRFEIELEAELFEMEIRYNDTYDFFTVDLYREGLPLVYSEKIVYGVPLFSNVRDIHFPIAEIIPMDHAGLETQVTYENFQETVFLVVK